jgi:hypothetical protein
VTLRPKPLEEVEMLTAADAVHTYILAKDGNRPFLMQQAFADDAEVMKVLAAGELTTIMDWLSALPYPWCSTDGVLAHMPVLAGLGDLKTYLEQAEPISSGF